jgi:NADPH-dependent 2,4-dienoyl-CoA reductase/sulfur reductase-like enzyme
MLRRVLSLHAQSTYNLIASVLPSSSNPPFGAATAAAATASATACGFSTTASMAAAREVAVVGGGISGLYCATVLSRHGHKVTVFDQGKHAAGE